MAMVIEQGIRPLMAPPIRAPATGPFCVAVTNCRRSQAMGAKPTVLRIGDTPSRSKPSRMTTRPATICNTPWARPMTPVATSTAPSAAAISPTRAYTPIRAP